MRHLPTLRLLSGRSLLVALLVVLGLASLGGTSRADARRRLAVVGFEGDRAEQFQRDVVNLLQRRHLIVAAEAWDRTADELGVEEFDADAIAAVAAQLQVDGVVTAAVEQRRDAYILRVALHDGRTGAQLGGTIYVVADGPRLAGIAERDLADELGGQIGTLPGAQASARAEREPAPRAAGRKPAGPARAPRSAVADRD